MTKKTSFLFPILALAAIVLSAQSNKMVIDMIGKAGKGTIAIPDFRGAAEAQQYMGTFNSVLWSEIEGSGLFNMAPKTMYPLQVPQTPQDFKPPQPQAAPVRRNAPAPAPTAKAPWLTDWSGPPVNATYLAFGYTAVKDNQLVLFGWFYNVTQNDISNAQAIGKLYFGSIDDKGARKIAQEFAADILKSVGASSLAGTKIVFVSQRTGTKEIWTMDYDGTNQKQLTSYRSISTMPSVSPDGTKVAFSSNDGGGCVGAVAGVPGGVHRGRSYQLESR